MLINFFNDFYGKNRPKEKLNPMGFKKPRKKIEAESLVWEVNEQSIPVELFREPKRASWRFSFGKNKNLLVRIPLLSKVDETNLLQEIQKRLAARMLEKPKLYEFFNQKTYDFDDVVVVGTRSYLINFWIERRKTSTAKLVINKNKRIIELRLDAHLDTKAREKTMSTLVSRIVGADFLPDFSKRVFELNEQFFKKKINNIRLKHSHSNWGSCSSSSSLNFSTRLLFAPPPVQDYVIIHELAHLVELNHSDRFWQLVADAMPDYKEKEKWLKLNSSLCRF